MNIESMRIRSYRSFKVDEHVPAVSPRGTSSGVREPFAHRETDVRVGGWVVR